MISLLSFFTLAPLIVSAARIPHHLLNSDASLVSNTKSALGLDIGPRHLDPRNLNNGLTNVVNNVPIVTNVLHVVTSLQPQIDAGLSFCVTLRADAFLDAGAHPGEATVVLDAGICLCIDANAEVSASPNSIKVSASSGAVYTGDFALKLRASVSHLIDLFFTSLKH